jgi:hypothetical protein
MNTVPYVSCMCRAVYGARNVLLAQPRQVEPSSEGMDTLTAMGFNDASARHALQRCDNNIEAAVNMLACLPAGWTPPDTEASGTSAGGNRDSAPAPRGAAELERANVVPAAELPRSPPPVSLAPDATDSQARVSLPVSVRSDRAHSESSGRSLPGQTTLDIGSESAGPADRTASGVANVEFEDSVVLRTRSRHSSVDVPGLATSTDSDESTAAVEVTDGDDGNGDRSGAGGFFSQSSGGDSANAPVGAPALLQAALEAAGERGDEEAMQALLQGLAGMNQVVGALNGGVEGLDDSLMSVLQRSASAEMEGAGRMTGALPILSMGGGAMNGLPSLHLNDDMRWEEVMPGFVDALMDEDFDSSDDEDADESSSEEAGDLEGEENSDDLDATVAGNNAEQAWGRSDSSFDEAEAATGAGAGLENGSDGGDEAVRNGDEDCNEDGL